MTTVLVLVGSLRADSVNRAIAHSAQEAAPEGVQVRIARGLERLFARGSGARLQRQAWERTGDLAAVVADLAERTEASARATGAEEG